MSNPAEPELTEKEIGNLIKESEWIEEAIPRIMKRHNRIVSKLKAELAKRDAELLRKDRTENEMIVAYDEIVNQLSERQDKLNHLIADEVSYRQEIAKLKAELAEKDKELKLAKAGQITLTEFNELYFESIPKEKVQELRNEVVEFANKAEKENNKTFADMCWHMNYLDKLLNSGKEKGQ